MGDYLITLEPVILVVHYVIIAILIVAILLQNGKGMNVGSVFGSGSQSLFGARGAGNFLTKITSLAALVLVVTSLSLATVANHKAKGSVGSSVIKSDDKTQPSEEAPATPEAETTEAAPQTPDAPQSPK